MSLINEKADAIQAIKELVEIVCCDKEDKIHMALDEIVLGNYEEAYAIADKAITDETTKEK